MTSPSNPDFTRAMSRFVQGLDAGKSAAQAYHFSTETLIFKAGVFKPAHGVKDARVPCHALGREFWICPWLHRGARGAAVQCLSWLDDSALGLGDGLRGARGLGFLSDFGLFGGLGKGEFHGAQLKFEFYILTASTHCDQQNNGKILGLFCPLSAQL